MRNTRSFQLALSSFVTAAIACTLFGATVASAQGRPPAPPAPPRAGPEASGQLNGLSPAAMLQLREQLGLTPEQVRRLESMQAELGRVLTPEQRGRANALRAGRQAARLQGPGAVAGPGMRGQRARVLRPEMQGQGAPAPIERAALRRALERRMGPGMTRGPGIDRGMGPRMAPNSRPRIGRSMAPTPRRPVPPVMGGSPRRQPDRMAPRGQVTRRPDSSQDRRTSERRRRPGI